jgi:hypothetical protein
MRRPSEAALPDRRPGLKTSLADEFSCVKLSVESAHIKLRIDYDGFERASWNGKTQANFLAIVGSV